MKIIKRILYSILVMIMLLCAVVMVCAFHPSLTNVLADRLAGDGDWQENGETDEGSDNIPPVQISGTDGEVPDGEDLNGEDLNGEELNGTDSSSISIPGAGDYVAPSQESITSPEPVRDRNGYEPIQESGEQIADEDAAALRGDLDTGNTGEGLSFDTQKYPYYAMLDEDQQALYRQIYANAMELTTSFAPAVTVTASQAKSAFEAVYNDHPELFWLETGYSCKYLRSGQCIELTLQYHQTAGDLEEATGKFEAAAQAILEGAQGLSGDYEKEKYVHDTLIATVDYDENASMNQSAYSALVNGGSVCAGYARAFQYLLMELGIPCYYCTGYSGEDHAWNIVRLEDGYYNVDVTWDDTDPSTYDYFNKSDADYAGTHVRKGMSVDLPACGGSAYRTSPVSEDPQKPLTWQSTVSTDAEDETQSALEKAGLTEDEVLDDLEEYYADCKAQMIAVGEGQQQFSNVIPQTLWKSIERIYSDGSYQKGYVEEALKQLEKENFAIQLQAERLDGGYYRLYHNISTW